VATFDQLPADQRAILELVVGRGQTYAELSTMLGMPPARVRELAREALGDLAPATAKRVDPDWRGQVADYLLGQQTGPESTATRGHLKRSEPARAWAFSLLDSLSHLYPNGDLPAIPDPDGSEPEPPPPPKPAKKRAPESVEESADEPAAAAAPAPAPRPAAAGPGLSSGGGLSPGARAIVRRRRIIGGVVGAAIIAVVVLLITGVIGGGGGKDKTATTAKKGTTGATTPTKIVSEGVLRKVGTEKGNGVAVIILAGTQPQLVVQTTGLTPSGQQNAYEVWLYNSKSNAVALGAQFTDANGALQGRGAIPANYSNYRYVVLSREKVGTNPTAPTNLVLRALMQAAPASGATGSSGATGATGP
jgi:Anti-sigma-K factor rskA, C-terminal/Sigma-70, region 4